MILTNSDILKERAAAEKKEWLIYGTTFFMLFFGMKLWLINTYGNATPYWDQWDGEAALLYKPFLDGTLTLKALIAPHNEHRILTTRLIALLLLAINKTWNPLLQMVVNAAIHTAVIIYCINLLTKVVGRPARPLILGFAFVVFAIPFGWENSLAGFQSQFYLVLLFSLAALWKTVMYDALSRNWWIGIFWAVLAFFSLASGIFILGSSAAIALFLYITGVRRTKYQLAGIVIMAVLFAYGFYLTPTIEGHAVLKAKSLSDLYHALPATLGWPVAQNIIGALSRNLPSILFVLYICLTRPPRSDRRWFLLGMVVWMVSQAISISYGRAVGALSPRYLDLFMIGLLVNLGCLISLSVSFIRTRPGLVKILFAGWLLLIFFSVARKAAFFLPAELKQKHDLSIAQETNTRMFVRTGDTSYLVNQPLYYIPYPDPYRLAMILGWPEVRKILPGIVRPALNMESRVSTPAEAYVRKGYYTSTPSFGDSTWGSWNVQGDTARGELVMRFTSPGRGQVAVPVAGYPIADSMLLEVEQNGVHSPLVIADNPHETWGTAYARVTKGDFIIRVKDGSTRYWSAVAQPVVSSRRALDRLTDNLLSHYYLFIVAGITMLFLIIARGLWKNWQHVDREGSE